MARPKKEETLEVISVRLHRNMVEAVDAVADGIRKEVPLLNVSRADAIRQLLAEALAARAKKRKK